MENKFQYDFIRTLIVADTEKVLNYVLFEKNDSQTRDFVTKEINKNIEGYKINNIIYDGEVLCDEKINTPDILNNNELQCQVFFRLTEHDQYKIFTFKAKNNMV